MNLHDFKCQIHNDLNFPVTAKLYMKKYKDNPSTHLHWHEHIEIIEVIQGSMEIIINSRTFVADKDDIICINSSEMHSINPDKNCIYHSITIGKLLCQRFDIDIGNLQFQEVVRDNDLLKNFKLLEEELTLQNQYYQQRVQILIMEMLVTLCRNHSTFMIKKCNQSIKQIELVKKVVTYLSIHYKEKIVIDEICEYVGYTKHYLCRTFKEVTDKTVIEYANILKCNYAHRLITSGQYNVGESAHLSGFTNLSYFTRTYKKVIGTSPSYKETELFDGN